VNAAGLKSKLNTFKKVLKELQPSAFLFKKVNIKRKASLS
jgi:hypothetical protein